MSDRFVIEKDNQVFVFDNYDHVPDDFDLLLEFSPEMPPCSGHHDHDLARHWYDKFLRLLEKQNAAGS